MKEAIDQWIKKIQTLRRQGQYMLAAQVEFAAHELLLNQFGARVEAPWQNRLADLSR